MIARLKGWQLKTWARKEGREMGRSTCSWYGHNLRVKGKER